MEELAQGLATMATTPDHPPPAEVEQPPTQSNNEDDVRSYGGGVIYPSAYKNVYFRVWNCYQSRFVSHACCLIITGHEL